MNENRLYRILLGPHSTEKSEFAADKYRHITFKVAVNATKLEIKQACEKIFGVVVEKVRILNIKGKSKRFKQRQGLRSKWKKALLCLKEGHDINLIDFE